MILTVALNATVNVSYEADEISWGAPLPPSFRSFFSSSPSLSRATAKLPSPGRPSFLPSA